MRMLTRGLVLAVVGVVAFGVQFSGLSAQDRLAKMPGVAQFQKMQTALTDGAYVSGAVSAVWAEDPKAFTYTHAGGRFRFDVSALTAVSEGPAPEGGGRGGRAGGRGGRSGGRGIGTS